MANRNQVPAPRDGKPLDANTLPPEDDERRLVAENEEFEDAAEVDEEVDADVDEEDDVDPEDEPDTGSAAR